MADTVTSTYTFDPNQVAYLQTVLAVTGHNPLENIDGVEGQVTADAVGSFLGHKNYDNFGFIEDVIENVKGHIREMDPEDLKKGLAEVREKYQDFDGIKGANGALEALHFADDIADSAPLNKLASKGAALDTSASLTDKFNTLSLPDFEFSDMGPKTDNTGVLIDGGEAFDRAIKQFGAENIPEGGILFVPKRGTAFVANSTENGLEVRQVDPATADLSKTVLDPDLQSDIVTKYQRAYANNGMSPPGDVSVKGVTFSTAETGPAGAQLDLAEYKGIKDRFFTAEAKEELKQAAEQQELEQEVFEEAVREQQTPGSENYLKDYVNVDGQTYKVDEAADGNNFSMEGFEAVDTEQAVLRYTEDGQVHEISTSVEDLEQAARNLRRQFRSAGQAGKEIRGQYKDFQKGMKEYQQAVKRGEFENHESILKDEFQQSASKTYAELGPDGTKLQLDENMARTLSIELAKMNGGPGPEQHDAAANEMTAAPM